MLRPSVLKRPFWSDMPASKISVVAQISEYEAGFWRLRVMLSFMPRATPDMALLNPIDSSAKVPQPYREYGELLPLV